MSHNEHFVWDHYADQPFPIEDKKYKKQQRYKHLGNILLTALLGIVIFPIAFLMMPLFKKKKIDLKDFFGIGVNLDKQSPELDQAKLIEELGIQRLLIRVPLADTANIDAYVAFCKAFNDKHITINILQSRDHIEDAALLKKDIQTLFTALAPFAKAFQIGNAINRTKWGFFSMGEYRAFYKTIKHLQKTFAPQAKLFGPSVIDYEYYYIIHILFSFIPRFDGVSALLYVDRRGAPENRQGSLNLLGKIDLLYSILSLSPFTKKELIITETNWPILNTFPYAPTSQTECVTLQEYEAHMVRYFLLAIASQKVTTVYWHQLISAGYGLIDQRTNETYPAFETLKNLLLLLRDTTFDTFSYTNGIYEIRFTTKSRRFALLWSKEPLIFEPRPNRIYTHLNSDIISHLKQITPTPIVEKGLT